MIVMLMLTLTIIGIPTTIVRKIYKAKESMAAFQNLESRMRRFGGGL